MTPTAFLQKISFQEDTRRGLEGANVPLRERESLKNKSAHLIPVPKGFVLYVNFIVGAVGTL
jgi:hypothetical protein